MTESIYIKHINEERIKFYKEFFKKNNFVLCKDVLTEEGIQILKQNIIFQSDVSDKSQFCRRMFTVEDDKNDILLQFQKDTLFFFQKILGEEYSDTYLFAMEYVKDSHLTPHLDLISNGVSATVCYEADKKYPIFVGKKYYTNNSINRIDIQITEEEKQNSFLIDADVGDIAMFNGRNYLHWRDKAEDDVSYKAVLTHYWKPFDWIDKEKLKENYIEGEHLYNESYHERYPSLKYKILKEKNSEAETKDN